jgi:hypothetical protein
MRMAPFVLSVLAAAATLAACSGTSGRTTATVGTGNNHPASTQVETTPTTAPTTSTAPATTKLGQGYTYRDGLALTVSVPMPFAPSDSAAKGKAAQHVVFTVTIVNRTGKNYDPSLFLMTVQSGNQEAETVYDFANGIGGSPSTILLPGRESTFKLAFGVSDPTDLVVQAMPGFSYGKAIFTS